MARGPFAASMDTPPALSHARPPRHNNDVIRPIVISNAPTLHKPNWDNSSVEKIRPAALKREQRGVVPPERLRERRDAVVVDEVVAQVELGDGVVPAEREGRVAPSLCFGGFATLRTCS